uniref:Uncharacterized protein n=1 Tax=Trichinella nativa TaxID=6335 RepID=A0A0V1KGV1_9BILA
MKYPHWSSFLSFMCFANYILVILSFWANIHISDDILLIHPFA